MNDKEKITIFRLQNVSACNNIGFPLCDNSTCYHSNFSTYVDDICSKSHVLCTSRCDQELCEKVFLCSDNRTIFHSQFCDGIADCADGSDEVINRPGFKCDKCILPQSNLYDNVAHCDNNTDLCFVNNNDCFHCFDNRLLISSEQVCDGVSDCCDMSDECLRELYFDTKKCKHMFEEKNVQCFNNEDLRPWYNLPEEIASIFTFGSKNSFIQCRTKFNFSIFPKKCDGRPECRDFSDECYCSNPPTFCNDSCLSYFLMGDRCCDGVEDPAWQYINKSECSRGFDEFFCPKRFKCKAEGNVNIDVLQTCDGKADCDNNSDENDCLLQPAFVVYFRPTQK